MGNYRFRLSDMIPNAWFHKFKNMNGTTTATSTGRRAKMQSGSGGGGGGSYRKKEHTPSSRNTGAPPQFHSQTLVKPGRASYYIPSRCEDKFPANPRAFDTKKYLVDPPRKSKKNHGVGRPLVKPSPNVVTSSISSACPCRPTITEDSEHNDDKSGNDGIDDDLDGLPCLEKTVIASSNCRTAISATDIIVDVKGCRKPEKTIQEFDLPPILTKPTKKEVCSVPKSVQKSPRRRSSAGSQRVKMRASTPRLSSKKLRVHRCRKSSALAPTPRRGLAGSFTVVKSSSNPQRDFRESMMEMIVANNIHAAAELEELLACYLSLNSSEYHDVIVKVFEQIWYDITDIKL